MSIDWKARAEAAEAEVQECAALALSYQAQAHEAWQRAKAAERRLAAVEAENESLRVEVVQSASAVIVAAGGEVRVPSGLLMAAGEGRFTMTRRDDLRTLETVFRAALAGGSEPDEGDQTPEATDDQWCECGHLGMHHDQCGCVRDDPGAGWTCGCAAFEAAGHEGKGE
jgi:hypothetical protein